MINNNKTKGKTNIFSSSTYSLYMYTMQTTYIMKGEEIAKTFNDIKPFL